MKGGPNAHVYEYPGGALGDEGLHAPLVGMDNIADISYVEFCPCPPEEPEIPEEPEEPVVIQVPLEPVVTAPVAPVVEEPFAPFAVAAPVEPAPVAEPAVRPRNRCCRSHAASSRSSACRRWLPRSAESRCDAGHAARRRHQVWSSGRRTRPDGAERGARRGPGIRKGAGTARLPGTASEVPTSREAVRRAGERPHGSLFRQRVRVPRLALSTMVPPEEFESPPPP